MKRDSAGLLKGVVKPQGSDAIHRPVYRIWPNAIDGPLVTQEKYRRLIIAHMERMMRRKNERAKDEADRVVKDIRRQTRRKYSSEDKIRIVLAGLRGEDSVAELCRQEGIAQSQYYSWSKEFLEAGKKRLAGDTAREANTGEVKNLRKEARDLKEVVAEQALELRLLKKSMYEDGGDDE